MTVSTVTLDPKPDDGGLESGVFAEQSTTGQCVRPIRLHGHIDTVDTRTGQVLDARDTARDGAVYVACKDRRDAVCPSCAATYRRDTYQLLNAGLAGGKGVPETVQDHPALLLTLTAPSFGLVHTRRTAKTGRVIRCRPRSQARSVDRCPHGVALACERVHGQDDPKLGQPLCLDCYDHDHQVVWNGHAGELWRRTTIAIRRRLDRQAAAHGMRVRLSFAKVAEDQERGVVHFHVLIRLDGHDPDDPEQIIPPPPCVGIDDLERACLQAAATTAFSTLPHPDSPYGYGWAIRWGNARADIIRRGSAEVTASECQRVAGYLAKYATKSTGASGAVLHRITEANIGNYADLDRHRDRLIQACWRIGRADHDDYRALRRWAHKLGFRGHFSTRSRHYGTTLGALRAARRSWQRDALLHQLEPVDPNAVAVITHLRYSGTGWPTTGTAALALSSAARAREHDHTAAEEQSAA